MAISIFNAKELNVKLKATIQASGKLGFSDFTIKTLKLSEQTYIALGIDDDTREMYFIVTEKNERAFKVCKTGSYFYLPTQVLFKSLGFDFVNKTIIFDLVRMPNLDEELSGEVYKMNKREKNKKAKEETMK